MRSAGYADDHRCRGPDHPREQEAEHGREVPMHVGRAGGRRPDRDERDLAETDLARPSGEEHERHRDDRVDDHRRGEVGIALVEERGDAPGVRRRRRPAGHGTPNAPRASSRARGGSDGRSPRASSVDSAWSSTGDSRLRRWSNSAPSTITKSAGSIRVPEPLFQRIATSTTPMPHDAAKITARFSMRPMTAAASARSRI